MKTIAGRLTRAQIAWRLAQDLPDGATVNLGIGMPERVADFVPAGREILFHSENGILGMGPSPQPGAQDPDLINAGKKPVTLLKGASLFHHADSFAMVRGRHLDYCVLGAFQVSQSGDLANWSTGGPGSVPAVGGAMDLAIGAKHLFIISDHCMSDGSPKMVERCSYPLTGKGVVERVYTDLAVLEIRDGRIVVREHIEGLSLSQLQDLTEASLTLAPRWRPLVVPPVQEPGATDGRP